MNRIKQINDQIAKAAHHRDQLHKLAKDFVRLHGEVPGSCEADELMSVILDGEEYGVAMRRVITIKKHRLNRSQRPNVSGWRSLANFKRSRGWQTMV